MLRIFPGLLWRWGGLVTRRRLIVGAPHLTAAGPFVMHLDNLLEQVLLMELAVTRNLEFPCDLMQLGEGPATQLSGVQDRRIQVKLLSFVQLWIVTAWCWLGYICSPAAGSTAETPEL